MKTKLIDKNLFFEGLHQLKTAGLICFLISIIGNVLSFIFACIIKYISYINKEDFLDNLFNMTASGEVKNGVLFFNSISCGITAIYVFTPIFTFLLFKFLFKRNASDFYHSLSVKRETLFFTFSLSALVMTLSIVAVCGLFSIIANGFILNILDFSSILPNFLNIVAGCLLIQSAITIGCAVSGRFFSALVASTMIAFYPRIFITALMYTIKLSTPVVNHSSFDMPLGNSYNVLTGAMFEDYMQYKSVIYSIILAAIYYFVAIKLFAKRKSEDARVAGTSKRIKAPMRIAFCLLFCLPSIIIEYLVLTQSYDSETNLTLIIPILIFYFIGTVSYFLIELFSQGRYKQPLKVVLQFGWVILINIVLVGGLFFTRQSIINYTPSEKTIESVSVSKVTDYYDTFLFYDTYTTTGKFDANEFFENVSIKDKDAIAMICDIYKDQKNNKDAFEPYYLTIGFKEGNKTTYRNVYFTKKEYKSIIQSVDIDDDYMKKLTIVPENIEIVNITDYYDLSTETELSSDNNPYVAGVYESAVKELKLLSDTEIFTEVFETLDDFEDEFQSVYCYDDKGNLYALPLLYQMVETQIAYDQARVYANKEGKLEKLEYSLLNPFTYWEDTNTYNYRWITLSSMPNNLSFDFKEDKTKKLLEYIKTEGKIYSKDKYIFTIEYDYCKNSNVDCSGKYCFFMDAKHVNEFLKTYNANGKRIEFVKE